MNRPWSGNPDLPSYIERTRRLYSEMDAAYAEAAHRFGFACSGCDDNCCEEKFYHYTLIEHLYIEEGINLTPDEKKKEIMAKAALVRKVYDAYVEGGGPRRIMCPLNFSGLCAIYEYRPMICRLHGIPHLIKKAGRPDERGPGCQRFGPMKYPGDRAIDEFDRSPLYAEMAALEIDFRKAVRFGGRYKKTVAEMILDLDGVKNNR